MSVEQSYAWTCPECNHTWISVMRKPSLCSCGNSRVKTSMLEYEARKRAKRRMDYALQKRVKNLPITLSGAESSLVSSAAREARAS